MDQLNCNQSQYRYSFRTILKKIKNRIDRYSPLKKIAKQLRFNRDVRLYNKLNKREDFKACRHSYFKCLGEWDNQAGNLGLYFWQDLWAARKIYAAQPHSHYDIGSRIDGFIAHIVTFMPVTLIDIRPLKQKVDGLQFVQSDATNLDNITDNSIESLSSLCAPEHFGLGRYGDPINPEGAFSALLAMQRVLKTGGHLYISVPIGDYNGVAFNAHRIFNPQFIVKLLSELRLVDFAFADFRYGKPPQYVEHADINAQSYGWDRCGAVIGMFEFVKTER